MIPTPVWSSAPCRSGLLAAGLALGFLWTGGARAQTTSSEDLLVLITSPTPGVAVFGEVEIAADVDPAERVQKVELFIDGELAGEATAPPFSWTVDVGDDNLEHRFRVVATGHDGGTAESQLSTPAIRVDAEVTAELQQLYVTVSDGSQRVLDLEKADFALFDNGNQQEMVTFARGDVRITAAILIDSSESMKGDRLRYALRGATAFLRGLRDVDDASMMLFSDRLLHMTPFSSDEAPLTTGLGAIQAAGGTALNDHVYMALRLLEHRQGRRVLVLLSDGIDSHSALRMSEVNWLARRTRALVYWLRTDPNNESRKARSSAWKNPSDYRTEYQQLSKTVAETGGRILTLARIQDAERAFRDILQELREQYVLGYYPSLNRGDGTWHRVLVRSRRGNLVIRTRGGYVDYF